MRAIFAAAVLAAAGCGKAGVEKGFNGVEAVLLSPTKVEVFLCFECDELFVYEGARSRGALESDPAHGSLLAMAKRLFPKDAAIQALK